MHDSYLYKEYTYLGELQADDQIDDDSDVENMFGN